MTVKKPPMQIMIFIKYNVDLKMDIHGSTLEEMIRSFEDIDFNSILDNAK